MRRYLYQPQIVDIHLPDGPVPEGSFSDASVSATDVDLFGNQSPDYISYISVDWGDGTSDSGDADQGGFAVLGHFFADDAGTATASADDVFGNSGGGYVSYHDIGIYNVAPTATLSQSFNDDTNTLTADLTEPYDPSQADTDAGFHYSVSTNYDALAQEDIRGSP